VKKKVMEGGGKMSEIGEKKRGEEARKNNRLVKECGKEELIGAMG